MKLIIHFIILLYSFCVIAQSKKEKIESLNLSLDSLNQVVKSERSISFEKTKEINDLKKQIEVLNKNEIAKQSEIDRLKSELAQLNNELEQSKVCNKFLNYSYYTSLKELNHLQMCSPPSLVKADFYRHYYEVILLTQIRNDFNVSNLSDFVLLDLFKERRKSILSVQFDQKDESEIISIVTELDRQFKADNYSDQRTSLTDAFLELLYKFYFNQLSNEYNVEVHDRFVLTFYNLNGAGTEGNVTALYEIKNNTIHLINVYNDILSKIETMMVKHFGKDCNISRDFSITKVNGSYEVKCTIGKFDEYWNGSGEIKFLTNDFVNYNSLMWGLKNSNGVVVNWKPY